MKKKSKVEVIELKPNPKCNDCWGRGWVALVIPGSPYREIRPCHCVKQIVKERPAPDKKAIQLVKAPVVIGEKEYIPVGKTD